MKTRLRLNSYDTWHQERQVRLTAQRILGEHLRDDRAEDKRSTDPPSPRFWPDIRLDLAGATLIDFDLKDCEVADADFRRATFSGSAWFSEATITGHGWFDGAVFGGVAGFNGATLGHNTEFNGTTFGDNAAFRKVTFSGSSSFNKANFTSHAWFSGATFTGAVVFGGATFGGGTAFDAVTFGLVASFEDAIFGGSTGFAGATLPGEGGLSFARSCVKMPDARYIWPTGWCLGPDGSGGYTVVRVGTEGNLTGY